MTYTEKRLELFREKIKTYDKDGGFIVYVEDEDNQDFDVELIEKFHAESIQQAKQEMLNSVRKEMACYECNGSGTHSTPSDYGPCESCAGTGFSNDDGSFNDLLSSIDKLTNNKKDDE